MHPPPVERLSWVSFYARASTLFRLPYLSEQPWEANSTTIFADEEPEALGGHPHVGT